MWDTLTSGNTFHGRMINKRKDGSLYTEDATISPVLDAAGNIVNYVAVKRDERRRATYAERLKKLRLETTSVHLQVDTRDLIRNDRDRYADRKRPFHPSPRTS